MSRREHEELACMAAAYIVCSDSYTKLKKKEKRRKRWWMDSVAKSRIKYNASDLLLDLQKEPSGRFFNFCRMSAEDFEDLLQKIAPKIIKKDTHMRECIPVHERLAIALRFFASGDSYVSIALLFKVSRFTVSNCVQDVSKAIITELKQEVKLPENAESWRLVARTFDRNCNFPNCLGALDGKHVVLECPANSVAKYFNYKGTYSIVLLALADANYTFQYVNIGCEGRISDGGVFANTSLHKKMVENTLNLPDDEILPGTNIESPFVILGDSAFAMNRNLMKPYPGIATKGSAERVFNYRLSRARRVVENTFGVMASIFRVFRKPLLLQPEPATNVVLACVILHNVMRRGKSKHQYCPPGTFDSDVDGVVTPGSWRNDIGDVTTFFPLQNRRQKSPNSAKSIRDNFAHYFTTTGKLSWQHNYC